MRNISSLFNSFCSNVAKQVARFFLLPVFPYLLPFGLLAQDDWLERCTRIVQMSSTVLIPASVNFFRLSFRNCIICVFNSDY